MYEVGSRTYVKFCSLFWPGIATLSPLISFLPDPIWIQLHHPSFDEFRMYLEDPLSEKMCRTTTKCLVPEQ